MSYPTQVRIVEVGPRDGLQNEKQPIDAATKIQLIESLAKAGVSYIEAGSFVNPKWVPQMAGSDEVFQQTSRQDNVTYAALTPNLKGYDRAIEVNADEVAIFAAASDGFSQKNINCSIDESLQRFEPIMTAAREAGIKVRGYVSCVVGCPYDGVVAPEKVVKVTQKLLDMGCYEVSLGDTIGVGTPASIGRLLDHCLASISADRLAVHLHDTYGQALANLLVALQKGIAVIDSSVAGLGGCPYAKGASGNVATEDVVYLLNGLGIEHGIDLEKLVNAGQTICQSLSRENGSKVARAMLAKMS